MLRPIKFRIWGKLDNRFIRYSINFPYELNEIFTLTNYLAFQQFTDLLDKNSKEIYDGDIVKVKLLDEEVVTRLVRWDNIDLKWGLEYPDFPTFCDNLSDYRGNIEIIGNVLENKDLIDKKKSSIL